MHGQDPKVFAKSRSIETAVHCIHSRRDLMCRCEMIDDHWHSFPDHPLVFVASTSHDISFTQTYGPSFLSLTISWNVLNYIYSGLYAYARTCIPKAQSISGVSDPADVSRGSGTKVIHCCGRVRSSSDVSFMNTRNPRLRRLFWPCIFSNTRSTPKVSKSGTSRFWT